MAQRPKWGLGRLIVHVDRSHTDTDTHPHSRTHTHVRVRLNVTATQTKYNKKIRLKFMPAAGFELAITASSGCMSTPQTARRPGMATFCSDSVVSLGGGEAVQFSSVHNER